MRVLLITFVALLFGCRDNPPVTYPINQFDLTKLALGPGDKIELTIFYGNKREQATYSLDSAGEVSVQFIGTVHAGGKNKDQVQVEIQNRLADGYLRDPVVAVNVVEINSLKLSVFGQVMHNGTIKFTPGMTITEAIAQSGGFSPLARKNLVQVTRKLDAKKQTYEVPVEMIGEGKRPNFPMMPGDEVFVPERPF